MKEDTHYTPHMAQNPNLNKRGYRTEDQQLVNKRNVFEGTVELVHQSLAHPFINPTALYFKWNELLILQVPILSLIYETIVSELTKDGVIFLDATSNLVMVSKDKNFRSVFTNHWLNEFIPQSILFIMSYGYLVFYAYKTPSGAMIPKVPRMCHIIVEKWHDEITGAEHIQASWMLETVRSKLWVINTPFYLHGTSPVDRIKTSVRLLIELESMLFTVIERTKHPVGWTSYTTQKNSYADGDPSMMTSNDMDRDLEKHEKTIEFDIVNNERMQLSINNADGLKDKNGVDYTLNNNILNPWTRLYIENLRSHVPRRFDLPQGATFHPLQFGINDLQHEQTRKQYYSEIVNAFGIDIDLPGSRQTDKKRSQPSSSSSKDNASSSAEIGNKGSIMRWANTMETILTQVFNIFHANNNIHATDPAKNYESQMKVTINSMKELSADKMFKPQYASTSRKLDLQIKFKSMMKKDPDSALTLKNSGNISEEALVSLFPAFMKEEEDDDDAMDDD